MKSSGLTSKVEADDPFEAEHNIQAKLRLTNKAFNFHFKSFIGLTIIVALAFLVLNPIGRHMPQSGFAHWLTDFSLGLTFR